MPDAHGREVLAGRGGCFVGEEGEDRVVHGQATLGHRQADRGGRETLAQREEHVRLFGAIGCPPPRGQDVAVAQQHQAVEFEPACLGGVDEGQDRRRGDAMRLGGARR